MSNKHRSTDDDPRYAATVLIRRLLLDQGMAHWRKYAVAFTLMAISAGCTALSAYLIGDVINQAYVNHNLAGIVMLGGVTVALFTVKGLATYGHSVMLSRIGNRIIAENQRTLFAKLLNEGLSFFSDRHSTEFLNRLSTGAQAATQVINLIITSFGRDLLSLIGLVTVMVVQDPLMSFFSFVVAPPAFLVLRKLVRRIYAIARSQFDGGTRIIETLQETLQGIRIVKAFTLEEIMRERFDRHVAAVEYEANKMARVSNRASPLMETLGGCAIAIAITYGGYRVINTGATPGQFFSFITAFLLAYEPAKRLARLNLQLNSGLVGVRVLFEVIDAPPTEPPDAGKPAIEIKTPRITFDDVQFGYRGDESVLRGMSFVAEPGKLTALVGPSGGGKSTVFNLILRFYDAERGKVVIDEQDVRTVSRRSLRQHVAYVGQDVFLFRGTIRENIEFGKPGASEDEIVAAAKAAYAHDFIMSFPRGYDTPVGEHGLQLSGGQRQRVAIARALIRNAPIILLDEATAALDSESELQVREAMDRLCQGRTTLAIAHRLHTVSHADCIYVIEGGRAVESGRHDELLRKSGRYASFYRLQLEQQEGPAPVAALASS
ncbi:MAG TPA: ABC transporter ATP-binding protein [Pseudolabrys sp.]|jgi:ATP-binding cassette subfamily B protein|nr:ABC transporter ATP-binding protein [Pseudolabrys sp.]